MAAGHLAQDGARAMRAHPTARVLRYPGTALSVALHDAPEVEQALRQTIKGWFPDSIPAARATANLSLVHREASGFATQSIYLGAGLGGLDVASATCAVIADLAQDFFEQRPGSLALHCGAFRYNDRLIAMTGPTRAGKSTLTARLTAEPDIEVFCDDVLPMLDDGSAFGLGIAPRLRLPLPRTCSPAFRAHVLATMGPHDDRYGYVCAPNVAPHGTRAMLSVLLILDRRTDGPARLHAVSDDEAMHYLLSQNMSDLVSADAAIARMSALMARITCLRLVYSDLEDAVGLLRGAFQTDTPAGVAAPVGPALPPAMRQDMPAAQMDPAVCWTRETDISLQTMGDSAFLWKPGTRMIWRMNALARAVWAMLEIPGSANEIGAFLAGHFDDKQESTIIADVNALLQALAEAGLIVAADIPEDQSPAAMRIDADHDDRPNQRA